MNLLSSQWVRTSNPFVALLVLQITLCIAVIFNIPVIRQIGGFVYLLMVPGFVLLRLMKIDGLNIEKQVLLSVGLSTSLVMLLGMLVNTLGPFLGLSNPLSPTTLLITLISFTMLASCLRYAKDYRTRTTIMKFSYSLSFCLLLLLVLVSTTVMGALFFPNYVGHYAFLSVIAVVAVLVVFGSALDRPSAEKLYAISLFAICLALILQFFLLTPYLLGGGGDIFSEYYVFRRAHTVGYWNTGLQLSNFEASKANSMLSVTILPEVYSQIMNLDGSLIFKFVLPSLASIAFSLGLFELYRTQVNRKIAFLAVFFFISTSVGLGWGPGKQLIGELFYILLFLLLLDRRITSSTRGILFMIFGFSLIVSHYSLSYIFLGIIFLDWVASFLLKKRTQVKLSLGILLLAITFAWYIYTSGASPFVALVNTGDYVFRSVLTDFFNPQSRGESVLRGIGAAPAVSLLHYMGRALSYLTELFIVIGLLVTVFKKKDSDWDYRMFASINMIMLAMNVIIPGIAGRFLMERWYVVCLIVLAPLCILGGKKVFEFLSKHVRLRDARISSLLILAVLVAFFLFNSGFVYEVTKDESWSFPLSMYRIDSVRVHETIVENQEISGATWLSGSVKGSSYLIYADATSMMHVLEPYGLIDTKNLSMLSNTTTSLYNGSFIYLRWTNLNENLAMEYSFDWNLSDISMFLESQNQVYSNGNCTIYGSIGT